MKFGIRTPNIKSSIKARTTGRAKRAVKRAVNPLYGKKGMGLVNNPKKAVYNKVYNKTSVGVGDLARAATKAPKRGAKRASAETATPKQKWLDAVGDNVYDRDQAAPEWQVTEKGPRTRVGAAGAVSMTLGALLVIGMMISFVTSPTEEAAFILRRLAVLAVGALLVAYGAWRRRKVTSEVEAAKAETTDD